MPHLRKIKAELKLYPVFICKDCNKTGEGESIRAKLECGSAESVAEYISQIRITSQYMPVGWSYNGDFRCGCYKHENN